MTKTCQYCQKNFHAKRRTAKFCSSTCRFNKWEEEHPRINTKNVTVVVVK